MIPVEIMAGLALVAALKRHAIRLAWFSLGFVAVVVAIRFFC